MFFDRHLVWLVFSAAALKIPLRIRDYSKTNKTLHCETDSQILKNQNIDI